jgi:hypothetical protein
VATSEEVEETLERLISRFRRLDDSYKTMLPSHRVVEAEFPDLDLVYHAQWDDGTVSELHQGPADDPNIRVSMSSDDLIAMDQGDLGFRRAFATNRLRLEASMTDLLRLRSVM